MENKFDYIEDTGYDFSEDENYDFADDSEKLDSANDMVDEVDDEGVFFAEDVEDEDSFYPKDEDEDDEEEVFDAIGFSEDGEDDDWQLSFDDENIEPDFDGQESELNLDAPFEDEELASWEEEEDPVGISPGMGLENGEMPEFAELESEDEDEYIHGGKLDEASDIMNNSYFLPGAPDAREEDFADDEPEPEGDYKETGDLKKFLDYLKERYAAIPKHDGKTIVGCERAKSYLEKLNREITAAFRQDDDGILPISDIEDVRTKILADVKKLSDHIKKLKDKEKGKKAELQFDENGVPLYKTSNVDSGKSLTKQAGLPNNIRIAITAFERAISSILVNSHVSAGHDFEEVFFWLCDKYKLDDREQLAIIQICLDSGFSFPKDRGTIGKDKKTKKNIDYVKNYLA